MPKKAKITLYRSSTCGRCKKASEVLRKALRERGFEYDKVVQEKFTDKDRSAREELKKINIMSAPTIRIGDKVLVEDEPTIESYVVQFLENNGF